MTARHAGLDPASRAFLEAVSVEGAPRIEDLPVVEARALFTALQSLPVEKLPAEIEDRMIPAGPKGQIPIRIIRPKGNPGPLPAVMYFHGGGWVLGDKDSFDWIVREIAHGAGAAVVFVEYSRSPEVKYPVAVEEAYAATKYVADNGPALNLDPSRIAVAGDSAGGNLAAVTALLAKDRGGPKIAHQILFNPATDMMSDTPSMREFADGYFLTISAMKWFGKQYLPDAESALKPTASPLRATIEQLRGLPPALVFTAEFDPLRDQGEAYAQRLAEAGVRVTGVRYVGMIHGFTMLHAFAKAPATQAAIAQANHALRRAFASKSEKGIAAN